MTFGELKLLSQLLNDEIIFLNLFTFLLISNSHTIPFYILLIALSVCHIDFTYLRSTVFHLILLLFFPFLIVTLAIA